MTRVIDMKAARKKLERAAYSRLVLGIFDNLNAEERRERKAQEQQVRAKAKKRI
ncbi:hypothetical protein [Cupriavidus necator]|uniref:hypothetical protein n=1 Tax=Cupriavidus necator TaxID=106590 RepID=UPI00148F9621|nr:hypothetical protein [Cupriavidus necator]